LPRHAIKLQNRTTKTRCKTVRVNGT
jgi:hypothetical protein